MPGNHPGGSPPQRGRAGNHPCHMGVPGRVRPPARKPPYTIQASSPGPRRGLHRVRAPHTEVGEGETMKNLKRGDVCWMINADTYSICNGDADFLVKKMRVFVSPHTDSFVTVIDVDDWDEYDGLRDTPQIAQELLFRNEKEAWEGLIRYYETKIEELASLHSNWIKASIIIQKLKDNYEQENC